MKENRYLTKKKTGFEVINSRKGQTMHELPKNTNSNLYFIYAQFSAEDLIKHFLRPHILLEILVAIFLVRLIN